MVLTKGDRFDSSCLLCYIFAKSWKCRAEWGLGSHHQREDRDGSPLEIYLYTVFDRHSRHSRRRTAQWSRPRMLHARLRSASLRRVRAEGATQLGRGGSSRPLLDRLKYELQPL
jgi:hypothetical protein